MPVTPLPKATRPAPVFSSRLSRNRFGWSASHSPGTDWWSRAEAAAAAIRAAVEAQPTPGPAAH